MNFINAGQCDPQAVIDVWGAVIREALRDAFSKDVAVATEAGAWLAAAGLAHLLQHRDVQQFTPERRRCKPRTQSHVATAAGV